MLLMERIVDRVQQRLIFPDTSAVFRRTRTFATYTNWMFGTLPIRHDLLKYDPMFPTVSKIILITHGLACFIQI